MLEEEKEGGECEDGEEGKDKPYCIKKETNWKHLK
jgi:hypothetical protein